MGKNKSGTRTPRPEAKKSRTTEGAPGKSKSKSTPLDTPGSQEQIHVAHTSQHTEVFDPINVTPPVSAVRTQLGSGTGKRKVFAALERAIEQNTQMFSLLAAHLGVQAPAHPAADATPPLPDMAAGAEGAEAAEAEDHSAEDAADAPVAEDAARAEAAEMARAVETEEVTPDEEEDAIAKLIDRFKPQHVPAQDVIDMCMAIVRMQRPGTPRMSNLTLSSTLVAPLGLTAADALDYVRVLRMNKGVVTCARLYDHMVTFAIKSKVLAGHPEPMPTDPGAAVGDEPLPVPYAVVAGAGDTPRPDRWKDYREAPNVADGLIHYCLFHGYCTHPTRKCMNGVHPDIRAAAQKEYEAEKEHEAQLRKATQESLEEARRREIIDALNANQQLTKEQMDFLTAKPAQDGMALASTSTAAPVVVAPALPAPPPLADAPREPPQDEVSLGPDIHLDLTNLSVARGARIQLPNPETFDGDLRKLVPDVYRTSADYVYALASTAIRSDVSLPEITKTFFRGTAKTWQHQIWIELQQTLFPSDPHCLSDRTLTKRLAVPFLLKFEQHFAAQLRQRSTVAMEAFLSDAYHQKQGESVALYFARFTTEVQEAGGFSELQKVTYFRAGLRTDLRKWCAVDVDGKDFTHLSDLFQHALAQERRAAAIGGARASVALTQPSLAYVQSGRGGRGGNRSGRSGARAGGRNDGGRNGGRGRDFTGRASGGVQKHRADYPPQRGGPPGDRAQQGYAQGHAQAHGRGTNLAAAPPGMTWSARPDSHGNFNYVLIPARQQHENHPQQRHYRAEPARGRGDRGRGRYQGRGGKYRVALIDTAHEEDMPLPPAFDLRYDAGADGH